MKATNVIFACLSLASASIYGDVWQDCTAWYMGGTDKDSDGVIVSVKTAFGTFVHWQTWPLANRESP